MNSQILKKLHEMRKHVPEFTEKIQPLFVVNNWTYNDPRISGLDFVPTAEYLCRYCNMLIDGMEERAQKDIISLNDGDIFIEATGRMEIMLWVEDSEVYGEFRVVTNCLVV